MASEIGNINVHGKLTTNMPCIAYKFNEYFSNIRPNLATLIDPCNGSFTDSISQHYNINQGIFVLPTADSEIINIVHGFKAYKFTVYVIKSVIKVIAHPLTNIFNLSTQVGSFPDIMKTAKVRPIFKSDDKCEISNYRSISVLPILLETVENYVLTGSFQS